jgi:transmembrane sensor
MSNIIEFPNRDNIEDEASLWIARLDRQLTNDERNALQEWLAANDMHRKALLEMAELWDKMDSLARLADLFQAPVKNRAKQPHFNGTVFYGAVAASLVFLLVFIGWNFISLPSAPTVVDGIYETAIGEQSNVNLPDGSQLVLNTNSRVVVEYSDGHRLFFLERGEINIEVAHDLSRPLSVIARNKIVQAVGTAFNVRIYNDQEVALLVTEGKVLVAQNIASKATHTIKPKRLPDNSLAVSKGEKILLGTPDEKIAKVNENEILTSLSWREGKLVFRGETLEQAVREINRYTPVQFEINDHRLKQKRIAGLFKAGDVDGLLAALEQNFNIAHEHANNKIRLYSRQSR